MKDFEDLSPSDVQEIDKGKVEILPDGRKINVRSDSSAKVPTLEIYDQKNKKRIKIRYKQ